MKWRESVIRLADIFTNIHHRLEMVAPEAHSEISYYIWLEVFIGDSPTYNQVFEAISDEFIANIEDLDSFDRSIKCLQEFIRSNFKWEDLFC